MKDEIPSENWDGNRERQLFCNITFVIAVGDVIGGSKWLIESIYVILINSMTSK